MPYATQQDIIDRYGDDALIVASDRDGDGLVDVDTVSKALADATADIDSYVARKYALPLPTVPDVLVRICVDIAMYRLSPEPGVGTEDRRTRYDDAIAFLKDVAKGVAGLGLEESPPTSVGAVTVAGPSRVFSRNSMKGLA